MHPADLHIMRSRSPETVARIRRLQRAGMSQNGIARELAMTRRDVSLVLRFVRRIGDITDAAEHGCSAWLKAYRNA